MGYYSRGYAPVRPCRNGMSTGARVVIVLIGIALATVLGVLGWRSCESYCGYDETCEKVCKVNVAETAANVVILFVDIAASD